MPRITLLPDDLISKIAAGEVIERPASVVKELVENSVDAGATRIFVDIKDSGKQLIKVSDNGEGMDEEDARNSLLRHATSKIRSVEDLFSIRTLGFRGEALASIAAVSQLSLVTKRDGQANRNEQAKRQEQVGGFNLVVEGGLTISSGICAAETGTTIEIRNLFFNTPARKKFLKTDPVELRHIVDVVTYYALCYPGVAFRLMHERYELLNAPAVPDLRSRISSLFGLSLAKEMLDVKYESDLVNVTGLIAPPGQARNDKQQQVLFVNNRWVRNEDITKAIYDAYHSTLFVHKHPVVVLHLSIDPQRIDVNVHPQKTEIKIEERELVYLAVYTAVKTALEKHNLIPVVDLDMEKQMTFGLPEKGDVAKPDFKYAFEPSTQTVMSVHETSPAFASLDEAGTVGLGSVVGLGMTDDATTITAGLSTPSPAFMEYATPVPATDKFPAMKLLGQVHKTFFVAETVGGAFFIDQHAAHERVLYEKLMEQYQNRKVEVQHLLQGEILECSPSEKMLLEQFQGELERYGFILESFGQNTFAVKTIPLVLGRMQPTEAVYGLLSALREGKNTVQETREIIITRMACRAAVMAGEELTNGQMDRILQELSMCKLPYTCPHGRPVMFKVGVEELERKFKRRG